ncbi:formate dehydrogenase [Novosphingobium sp. Gsoil 351]|nr:formate dehydrogenase [Novosphingobium sp. Gsoil 351]
MIDQIALNFAAIGQDNAVAATADHIVKFWDPRMKAALLAGGADALSPIARGAVATLAQSMKPPPQTRATVFNQAGEGGHSDAG